MSDEAKGISFVNGKGEISENDYNELMGLKDKFAQFETLNTQLTAQMDKLTKSNQEYEAIFSDEDALKSFLSKKGGETPQDTKPTQPDDTKMDDWSITQVVGHFSKLLNGMKEEMGKYVDKTLGDLDLKVGKGFSAFDVALNKVKYTDLVDFKDQIVKISAENPTWGTEKCYLEAKKTLKLKETEVKEAEVKKQEEDKTLFSEKGQLPESVTKDKNLTPRQIAEKVYERTMSGKEK